LEAGRKDDALSEAQEAVRLAPDNPEPHLALGRAYFAGAEEDQATAEYEKALKLNPKEGEAYLALGQIRFFQRRYVQAQRIFSKPSGFLPTSPRRMRAWRRFSSNRVVPLKRETCWKKS